MMWNRLAGFVILLTPSMAKQIMLNTWAEEKPGLLEKRLPDEQYHTVKCMDDDVDELAMCAHISEGIDYLNSKGDARIDLDPGECSRVSCSYGAQIQICNQGGTRNNTALSDIARTAQEIMDKCSTQYGGAPACMVRGTIWDLGDNFDTQTYVGVDSC